ncbi:hypothetical protein FBALC1_00792 [Flavobacteriales bacterium ALC-1]|nr:hypothetical protein FBALC1_00792 [Flavobacteriales bacterium ALC-1]
MTVINSIALFVAINLLVVGLSHLLQPKMWLSFFQLLTKKGLAGNTINALIHFGFGSLILSFHFIWSWPRLLITIYALLITIKGIIYLLFPKIGLRNIALLTEKSISKFKWTGLIMTTLSVPVFYNLYRLSI